jgi:hypothetical protein
MSFPCFVRDRRAALGLCVGPALRHSCGASWGRQRKGFSAYAKTAWRRCSTGTNHISAFGVWQAGSRRCLKRINRRGETRWHRLPFIGHVAISERGKL